MDPTEHEGHEPTIDMQVGNNSLAPQLPPNRQGALRLCDKVAIITGAGSGIGAEASRLFATEGASVVCVDINAESAERRADDILTNGGNAIACRADVSVASDMAAVVDKTIHEFGRIDILFANAGAGARGSAADTDLATWDQVIKVNQTGAWLSAKSCLPAMMQRGAGSIIFTSTVGAIKGYPQVAAYSASKASIIGLARQMAVEYGPSGIRVNVICPGTIDTPLKRRTLARSGLTSGGVQNKIYLEDSPEVEAMLATETGWFPLRRLGTPLDIASAALFLASDDSSFVSGIVMPVDGGLSAT